MRKHNYTIYELQDIIDEMKKVGFDAAFEAENSNYALFEICFADDSEAYMRELAYNYPDCGEFDLHQIEEWKDDGCFYSSKEEEEKARESLKKAIAKWVDIIEWLIAKEIEREEREYNPWAEYLENE